MSTPSLDDLFDFSRLRKNEEPKPEPPPPVRRRRVVRDREALKSVRPAQPTPIDVDAEVQAARVAVRARTSQALESLGVDTPVEVTRRPASRVVDPVRPTPSRTLQAPKVPAPQPLPSRRTRQAPKVPTPQPLPPRWRLVVRSAGALLEFFVGGVDVVDAVTRATPAIAGWMRAHGDGAAWRVETVEDLAGAML